MNPGAGSVRQQSSGTLSDSKLIEECLHGHEWAWASLIAKYKNLIFSIPIRYRFQQDEAADVFQAICTKLVYELPRLRDTSALPAWLIRVTHNECFHRKQNANRFVSQEEECVPEPAIASGEIPDNFLEKLQREQNIRNAIQEISMRCRELIYQLFFELPARPYQEVAASLGLATGSIGFIRKRCLEELRNRLKDAGGL